jgi:hypothetical protein
MRTRAAMLAFAVMALARRAWAEPPVCPASMVVSETVDSVPDGWKAIPRNGERRLYNVSVADGPFDQLAEQVPEERETGKHTSEAVWDLPVGETFWLVCHYANTNVTLARKLDPGIRRCVVSYKQNVMKKYACK